MLLLMNSNTRHQYREPFIHYLPQSGDAPGDVGGKHGLFTLTQHTAAVGTPLPAARNTVEKELSLATWNEKTILDLKDDDSLVARKLDRI